MMKCGLLGEHLQHSYSPEIHAALCDYAYDLYEVEPARVETFLREGEWDGLNVTIPYKKTAYAAAAKLGRDAERAGSVNTLIHLPDGSLYGDSTDVYGFRRMVEHAGIPVAGKKVVVLGSGGASLAVLAALQDLAAGEIVVVSRRPETLDVGAFPKGDARITTASYETIGAHADADVLVNATPVGMYPKNGEAPVGLGAFSKLVGVLDLIYNPCRTALLLDAEERNIPYENGLYMLVAQAKRSAEIFTGKELPDSLIDEIYGRLNEDLQNVALIGMPGAGKSVEARRISEETGRTFIDTDEEVTVRTGMTPEQWILTRGEETFRKVETEVLRDVAKLSHAVISTGGGVVTRPENYPILHQNSRIIWVKRDLGALEVAGRPISQRVTLEKLYEIRKPLYEAFADEEREL